ncbi:MAG: ribonuclease R [Veillonellaceae bacterium]|nr:ribonuclease R [Veillonellaceae bacterium]
MARKALDRVAGYRPGQLVTGIYKGYAGHFGFLITAEAQEDIYIGKGQRGSAMHNDKVQVEVIDSGRSAGRYEGQVVRVLERANETVVGTFELQDGFAVVTPDDERLGTDVYIPEGSWLDAKSGAKVLVRLTAWPEPRRMAEGEVAEVLGYEGDTGLDISLIIARHHLPKVFPEEVLREAEQVAAEPITAEGRRDFRETTVITVDGADAKDLDDAVTVRDLPNGNWELGVHIADVSHYVRPGSALDREAYRRGTSVYLADRVLPMLPEVLSNGSCSLNPNEERYTMSAVMEITPRGDVVRSEIGPGIIRSARRCTYAEIRKALLEDIYPEDLAAHLPMLRSWKRLTEALIAMRAARGALNFDFPEYKIILAEDGTPLRIVKRDRTIAERMIEEAMLIANETVARYISANERTAIFRVHQTPDKDKLQIVIDLMRARGVEPDLKEPIEPLAVQRLLQQAQVHGLGPIVEMMTLRSLPQAYYDIVNWGHFGLASECYTHFTSPIRRYPDLNVHRLIRQLQAGERQNARLKARLADVAAQSSMAERRAVEAERETNDLKRVEYMAPFVGEAFDATVTGMTGFGIFVGLENGAEGLIRRGDIEDGQASFDERDYTYRNRNGEVLYCLGDSVRVTLAKADIENRRLDFVLGEYESLAALQAASERQARVGSDKGKKKSKSRDKAKHGGKSGRGGKTAERKKRHKHRSKRR